MAGLFAKYLGWTYSRTLHVLSDKIHITYPYNSIQIAKYSIKSQFMSRSRKRDAEEKKKRYLKRKYSLDADHDKDIEGMLLLIMERAYAQFT